MGITEIKMRIHIAKGSHLSHRTMKQKGQRESKNQTYEGKTREKEKLGAANPTLNRGGR